MMAVADEGTGHVMVSAATKRRQAKEAIEKLEAMISEGDPIDISVPIDMLCVLLGLDKTTVARLEFEPTVVTATVLLTKPNGAKYVDPDDPTRPAQETRLFRVRT